MEFLSPLFLWFIPMVLLPIILNILFKASKKEYAFPLYFLFNRRTKGRGVNIRNILKTILRMLIILNLIFIFSHPIKGRILKQNKVILFDNSVHSSILDKEGNSLFSKGVDILKSIYREGDTIVAMSADYYEYYDDIEKIKIIHRPFDLKFPENIEGNYVIISPMTSRIDLGADFYSTFPDVFNNAGIMLEDLSVLNKTVSLKLYNQGEKKTVSILSVQREKTTTLFSGIIEKDQSSNIDLRIPYSGTSVIELQILEGSDQFAGDDRLHIDLPDSLNFRYEYATLFMDQLIKGMDRTLKLREDNNNYDIVISNIPGDVPGIYFIPSETGPDSAFLRIRPDYPAFTIRASDINEHGKLLIEGASGKRIAVLKDSILKIGFMPDIEYMPDLKSKHGVFIFLAMIDEFLKELVFDKNKEFERNQLNAPIIHYPKEKTPPPIPEKIVDYRPLLLILMVVLIILEFLL